jgi:hypothetical protein
VNTVLPDLGVVLVDGSDLALRIDINDHADMTLEFLAVSFDDDLARWSHNVIRASTNPYLLNYTTCGCWMDCLRYRY